MTFFKCDRCQEEFEVNSNQDEDAIERQYFGLYGFFPEEVAEEETVYVCEPCYENYLHWHYSQTKEQQEAITDEIANYYGLKPR